jgi:hypothetical protein
MRRTAVALLLTTLVASASPVRAQVFGQYTGGSLVPINQRALGGYVELNHDLFGLLGQFRTSLQDNVDFGFQGGFALYDLGSSNLTAVRLGADVKMLVFERDSQRAFDLAAGAAIGVETADNLNVLKIGPSAVASRAFGGPPTDPRVRPYAAVQVLFMRQTVHDEKDTGLSVPIHVGTELRLGPGLKGVVEAQGRFGREFGNDFSFSTGVTTVF